MRFVWWVTTFAASTAGGVLAAPSIRVATIAGALMSAAALALVLGLARGHRPTRARMQALPPLLIALGLGCYVGARASRPPVPPPAVVVVLDDDREELLEGVVIASPEAVDAGARLRLSLGALQGALLDDALTVAISVRDGVPELLPGDGVRFSARLRSVRGLANPGVPDGSVQARAAGIEAYASVSSGAVIERLTDTARGGAVGVPYALRWPLRVAARAHEALHAAIVRHARGVAATESSVRFLFTAVLGERAQVGAEVEDGFRAAGATHVLSVSGLHLAAVGFVFFVGLRRALGAVPRLPLWIDPRRIAAGLALPAVAFYTVVSGNAVATVRSALMMGVVLTGVVVGRRAPALVAIAAAVLILMAWSPLVLFDVSFQLSIVSVLALALGGSRLAPAPAARDAKLARKALAGVGRLVAATAAAGAATAPLVAHHFGEVTPAAPIGNLLLVPLVEMIVVPFGLAGAALGALGAALPGGVLLTVATLGARLALVVAAGFRGAAPVWLTRAPSGLETIVWVAGAIVAVMALPRAVTRRRFKLAFAGTLLAVGLVSATGRELARRLGSDLIVTFLDVGQGDAAVIQAPGGTTILVDGGGSIDGAFDPGARVIEPFLRARGIARVDLIVLSHPHPDHMGGLPRIIDRFAVGALWTSGDDGHDPRYGALVEQARRRGALRPRPSGYETGGLTLRPLGPYVSDAQGTEQIGPPEGTSVNDASLVVRATFGRRALLFVGDLEADGEGELTGRRAVGETVAADVLKVPHHGSRTSSGVELIEAVRPRLAVMSLGWKNRFHFPNPEVLNRYAAHGVRVLRTDRDGAVTLRIAPDGEMATVCARGCP